MKRTAKFLFLTLSAALLASCGQKEPQADPTREPELSATPDAAGNPTTPETKPTAEPEPTTPATEPTTEPAPTKPAAEPTAEPDPTEPAADPTAEPAPTEPAADPTAESNPTESGTLPDGFSALCPDEVSKKRADTAYGTVIHKTYASKTTGLDRGVSILLPPNYSDEKTYPVLYLLHGIFGNEYTLIQDASCKIPEISANLAADGLAKEMLIVLPDMYAKTDPAQAPAFTAEAVAPYDNFINDLVNDLIPYIEENFSVLTDRENRAIAGFSMGGRESLFIGFSRPDLFSSVGAISPAPGLTPGRDWAMSHPGQFQEEELVFDASAEVPYLMVCCGDSDKTVGKFPESYHRIMTENGVEHVWYEIPGADHDSTAIRSGLNNFLSSIFR
ncbi:MAG: esterase family protein [Lachnospiraceae bacterium]|nr:esterase family protein [Lachnospiraceae bacterium]